MRHISRFPFVLAAVLVAAACVCIAAWRQERALAGTFGFPLDDAWIHNVVARNLARGLGWSFNPGEAAQPSSGPLWTLLVGAGFALFGPSVWVPKVWGVLCFLGCVAGAWRLARLLSGSVAAAAIAAGAVALSAPMAWHGLSGMETPLAALAVTWGLDAFYRWRRGRRRFAWGVWVAVATAARPEALVLLPILALERVLAPRDVEREGAMLEPAGPSTVADASGARREALREVAVATAIALVLLVPYFALNLRAGGALFPSTFAAKAGATGLLHALAHFDVAEIVVALSLYPYVWTVFALAFWARTHLALLMAAPVGAWVLARGRAARTAWAPGLLVLLLPALRGMAAPHQTPPIHNGRYIACILPLLAVCAAVGVVFWWRSTRDRNAGDRFRSAFADRRTWLAGAGIVLFALAALVRLELRVPQEGAGWASALRTIVPGAIEFGALHPLLQTERLGLLAAVLPGLALLAVRWARGGMARGILAGVAALAIVLQVWAIARLPQQYARNVRNIEQMDVALGRWVHANVQAGERVAVCDIGAIAWFGERRVVDIYGLATPAMAAAQSPSHLRTLGALRQFAPEWLIVFPAVFPQWVGEPSPRDPMPRPPLFAAVQRKRIEDNTILASHVAIVYAADWNRFDRWVGAPLLDVLDSPDTGGGLRAHWRRGLYNLGLRNRSDLFTLAGDASAARNAPAEAEPHYRRAIALDAANATAWSGLLQSLASQREQSTLEQAVVEQARALPNSAYAQQTLGDLWASRGRVAEAAAAWEAALRLCPYSEPLLARVADAARQRGDLQRAAEAEALRVELQRLQSQAAPR